MKWKYSDFDKTPELSPDLEWMVQSGQVSRQMFLETLIKDYYALVYRLALSLLNDGSAARAASRDIFSQLVLSTHNYRDQVGMDAWVCQVAYQTIKTAMRRESFWRGFEELTRTPGQFTDPLERQPATEIDHQIWQQVDLLGDEQRIPLVLHFANDWAISRIAETLKISQSRVDELIQSSLLHFTQILGDYKTEDLERRLKLALQERYPLPDAADDEIRQFTQKVERQTGKRRILGRGMTTTREMVILGIALVVVILAIWGGNHFLFQSESDADSPGSRLERGGLASLEQRVSPMQLGGASEVLISPVSESWVDRSASEISMGRYSAFENKDRIRRFRPSQPTENEIVPSTIAPTDNAPIPSTHKPVKPR